MTVDMINHPPHYGPLPGLDFDCITVTRELTFSAGNAVKYMWRADKKGGLEDVKKARWYVTDMLDHDDDVYLPWNKFVTDERLHLVARVQADHNRVLFFNSVRMQHLPSALDALNNLLAPM